MKIDADKITKLFKTVWNDLSQINLEDMNYCEISPDQIIAVANTIPGRFKRVQGEQWDCDDIARNLVNECRKWGLDNSVPNPAIFKANGIVWNRETELHTACVYIYNDSVFCFEPQTYEYWKATNETDFIYKVE